MTVEVFGQTIPRATVEALIEAMIAALDHVDGDFDAETETDEDDQRQLAKVESRNALLLIPGQAPRQVEVVIERPAKR